MNCVLQKTLMMLQCWRTWRLWTLRWIGTTGLGSGRRVHPRSVCHHIKTHIFTPLETLSLETPFRKTNPNSTFCQTIWEILGMYGSVQRFWLFRPIEKNCCTRELSPIHTGCEPQICTHPFLFASSVNTLPFTIYSRFQLPAFVCAHPVWIASCTFSRSRQFTTQWNCRFPPCIFLTLTLTLTLTPTQRQWICVHFRKGVHTCEKKNFRSIGKSLQQLWTWDVHPVVHVYVRSHMTHFIFSCAQIQCTLWQ